VATGSYPEIHGANSASPIKPNTTNKPNIAARRRSRRRQARRAGLAGALALSPAASGKRGVLGIGICNGIGIGIGIGIVRTLLPTDT